MDLNNFGPFSSNTWGTVVDWFILLVTSLTAYYLWKTLRSQDEIKRLELKRYVNGIMPSFKLQIAHFEQLTTKDSYEAAMSFLISNTNGIAKNVSINITAEKFESWNFWSLDQDTPENLPIVKDDLSSMILNADFISDRPGAHCELLLNFNNEIGDRYSQKIIVTITGKDSHVDASVPIPHTPTS